MKSCLVYETLNQVSELQLQESKTPNTKRLSGVFGVAGIKNNNNRIYEKSNYGQMVENLQKVIAEEGCAGELEHPNSMNINLENVSHKIESIQMNEDGTVTGTILLLNTPKGRIAQALVEGGLPLFISSRGAGSIDENGNVTLSTIKTYDLVGTPGFSQAKLNLTESQTFESLNENLCIVFEKDEEEKKEGEDNKEKDKEEGKEKETKDSDSEEGKKEGDSKKEDDDDKKSNEDIDMNEIKETIDSLKKEVEDLKAQLHITQEALENTPKDINYEAIEKWIKEEFGTNIKSEIAEGVEKWTVREFAPMVEGWVTNEFAPMVEGWVSNEFAPMVEGWVSNEFAPMVEGWVTKEFAPMVEGWVSKEFAPVVEGWVTKEFASTVENWISEEYSNEVEKWINEEFSNVVTKWVCEEVTESMKEWCKTDFSKDVYENINDYMESRADDTIKSVDAMLEALEGKSNVADAANAVNETLKDRWSNMPIVEGMPSNLKPLWNMCSESKKEDIISRSRLYDFTREGVLESFWNSVDFAEKPTSQVNENETPKNNEYSNYQNSVISALKMLRH